MQTTMNRACVSAVVASVLAVLVGSMGLAQSPDSQVGTWKIDLAESTYRPRASTEGRHL
jgi:hypothetical protein